MASELHMKYNAQVARKQLVLSHCKLLQWGKNRKNTDINWVIGLFFLYGVCFL